MENVSSYKSKYFTMKEMIYSATAEKNNIDNTPKDEKIFENLFNLMATLDVIRELNGGPVYVSSGYRCQKVNELVGGVKTSQHMKGQAADIKVGSKEENKILMQKIIDNNVLFD